MKKWLLGIALAVTSAIAFALPSPHQIEDALAAHDYDSARSMVQQVLQERPDSARAHLLDAFILEHVDHNVQAANTELTNAANLDRKGDVKNSSLFGRTVAEIDAQGAQRPRQTEQVQPVVQTQSAPLASYQAPPEKHSGHGLLIFFVLLFGVGGLIVWLFIRGATRRKTDVYVSAASTSGGNYATLPNPASTTFERRQVGVSSGYVAPQPQVIVQHTPYVSAPQPVIINNGGGYGRGYGNDGFTEGLILGEVLEDSRENRRERDRRDSYSSGSNDSYTPAPYAAPTPTPAPASSYSNERASYSSGSDDSWSSKSSSSDSYSSSSSSSSWDSGSSSSSYDSGSSSYDSGSSGGGSDW